MQLHATAPFQHDDTNQSTPFVLTTAPFDWIDFHSTAIRSDDSEPASPFPSPIPLRPSGRLSPAVRPAVRPSVLVAPSAMSSSSSLWVGAAMLFNFASSVGIITLNKIVFQSYKFNFPTFLTGVHFVFTLIGLIMCNAAGTHMGSTRDATRPAGPTPVPVCGWSCFSLPQCVGCVWCAVVGV